MFEAEQAKINSLIYNESSLRHHKKHTHTKKAPKALTLTLPPTMEGSVRGCFYNSLRAVPFTRWHQLYRLELGIDKLRYLHHILHRGAVPVCTAAYYNTARSSSQQDNAMSSHKEIPAVGRNGTASQMTVSYLRDTSPVRVTSEKTLCTIRYTSGGSDSRTVKQRASWGCTKVRGQEVKP